MAARPIDAAEGYELFARLGGDVELDEINEHLRGLGLREVSPRMYTHYQKLRRHGYSSYITINRLDLAVAGEYAWSDDMRARYPEVARPLPAELVFGAKKYFVAVERLGAVSASVVTEGVPPAGASVVLMLQATGIERTGSVVRSDPSSGRFHMAFDSYTSLPVASADSPVRVRMRFDLPSQAESVTALADLMLRLDRFLIRSSGETGDLVRVASMRMNSPLDLTLVGSVAGGDVLFLRKVVEMRKAWHEGTKAKYEAEGIGLDNVVKRRGAQVETSNELAAAIEGEFHAEATPLLDELETATMPKGEPGDERRGQIIEAATAALELPFDLEADLLVGDDPG